MHTYVSTYTYMVEVYIHICTHAAYLNLAARSSVSFGAATFEIANVIDAFAIVLTWIRFAFIIFKIAEFTSESCDATVDERNQQTIIE